MRKKGSGRINDGYIEGKRRGDQKELQLLYSDRADRKGILEDYAKKKGNNGKSSLMVSKKKIYGRKYIVGGNFRT